MNRNVRTLPLWGDYNKYPKHMFYEEIRNKTKKKKKKKKKSRTFFQINLLIKYFVQQQTWEIYLNMWN